MSSQAGFQPGAREEKSSKSAGKDSGSQEPGSTVIGTLHIHVENVVKVPMTARDLSKMKVKLALNVGSGPVSICEAGRAYMQNKSVTADFEVDLSIDVRLEHLRDLDDSRLVICLLIRPKNEGDATIELNETDQNAATIAMRVLPFLHLHDMVCSRKRFMVLGTETDPLGDSEDDEDLAYGKTTQESPFLRITLEWTSKYTREWQRRLLDAHSRAIEYER